MRITVYRDVVGGWRWRLRARNGRIVADSAESYVRRGDCLRLARLVAAGGFELVVEE